MSPIENVVASPPPDVSEAILCVDDDRNILDALQRQFRKKFRIETAVGAEQALAAIASRGPFAVVISDLRMPGMNGIEFLAAVRALAPDTVRIMLTGQADMADAIAAVNQDAIFRFLLKPSSAIILSKVIESALEQHRLLLAERQLTQQTLIGCVEVLAEVLSIVDPVLFSRTNRVLRCVRQLAKALDVQPAWQVEAAAMLSQIGWVTVPSEIVSKVTANQPLSAAEAGRFREHPAAAARMLERIPRLETVARIIATQLEPPGVGPAGDSDAPRDVARFGAVILRAAIDFDERLRHGLSHSEALSGMRIRSDIYPADLIAALARLQEVELGEQTHSVPFSRLAAGMILEQDICCRNGMCLIGRGQQITATLLQRLRGFSTTMDTEATVLVRIPEPRLDLQLQETH
jgi:FixJ family two-component response regulator